MLWHGQVFSFLAVATSLIGFILGLTDFISDNLKVWLTVVKSLTGSWRLPLVS